MSSAHYESKYCSVGYYELQFSYVQVTYKCHRKFNDDPDQIVEIPRPRVQVSITFSLLVTAYKVYSFVLSQRLLHASCDNDTWSVESGCLCEYRFL